MTSSHALNGVKVVDLASMVAGPLAASILGDLGAEVVKIEPLAGDESRTFGETRGDMSGVFAGVNRNKRSLAIDLRDPRGAALARCVCEQADVIIDNARASARAKVGLDAASLRARAPRLITAIVTAYGNRGPYANRPGMDPVAQALSGFMAATGTADRGPNKAGPPIADAAAGYLTVVSILAALLARTRTGVGQEVHVSLLDALIHLQSPWVGQYLFSGFVQPRLGNASTFYAPYDMFETADGEQVHVVCHNDRYYQKLCTAIERQDLAVDPRFQRNPDRLKHREALGAEIAAWFKSKSSDEVLRALAEHDVIHAQVLAYPQTFTHPQVLANGMRATIPGATAVDIPGLPMSLSATPPSIRRGPCHLGEHTIAVLREFGISADEIATLAAAGVVHAPIVNSAETQPCA